MRKAIIGGTGVYDTGSEVVEKEILTAYGSVTYDLMKSGQDEIIFLARHGKTHGLPPHKINYRANMMALKMLEVTEILGTCAVGSMNDRYAPGDVVVINDFIDFTQNRIQTFYEGDDGKVVHVEMTDPYCSDLRNRFIKNALTDQLEIKGECIYVCTQGPRFETAAEIRLYKNAGGDVVGMTNVPEVVLAKELGMCYAAVGIITNWCTGIKASQINGHQISDSLTKNKIKITELFIKTLSEDKAEKKCNCGQALIVL